MSPLRGLRNNSKNDLSPKNGEKGHTNLEPGLVLNIMTFLKAS